MRVTADFVVEDPEAPRLTDSRRVKDRRASVEGEQTSETPIVLPAGDGRYVIVVGHRQVKAALEAGARELEVTVRNDLTDQEAGELRLAEYYYSSLAAPMELGRAFMRHREKYHVTQQELARRTGITPGTIHHYESLIRTLDPSLGEHVDSGELTFKEARSIADIPGFSRQREVAEPFIRGRLSSVYVERIVGLAKSSPELSLEDIIDRVVNKKKASPPPKEEAPAPADSRDRFELTSVEGAVLELAGELDTLRLQVVPEYLRLKLISSLRILETRVRLALGYLNSGSAVESHVPRPMAGKSASGAVAGSAADILNRALR